MNRPVDIVERLRTADFDTVTQEDLHAAVAEIVRLRSLLAPADGQPTPGECWAYAEGLRTATRLLHSYRSVPADGLKAVETAHDAAVARFAEVDSSASPGGQNGHFARPGVVEQTRSERLLAPADDDTPLLDGAP